MSSVVWQRAMRLRWFLRKYTGVVGYNDISGPYKYEQFVIFLCGWPKDKIVIRKNSEPNEFGLLRFQNHQDSKIQYTGVTKWEPGKKVEGGLTSSTENRIKGGRIYGVRPRPQKGLSKSRWRITSTSLNDNHFEIWYQQYAKTNKLVF